MHWLLPYTIQLLLDFLVNTVLKYIFRLWNHEFLLLKSFITIIYWLIFTYNFCSRHPLRMTKRQGHKFMINWFLKEIRLERDTFHHLLLIRFGRHYEWLLGDMVLWGSYILGAWRNLVILYALDHPHVNIY